MFKWLSSEKNLKLALKGLGLGIAFLALLSFFGYLAVNQKDPQPCDKTELPRRCYRVSNDGCEILWKHINMECKDFVNKLSTSPSQLTGPILAKCRFAKFDRANSFARTSDSSCLDFFEDIEGWRRRNLDER